MAYQKDYLPEAYFGCVDPHHGSQEGPSNAKVKKVDVESNQYHHV